MGMKIKQIEPYSSMMPRKRQLRGEDTFQLWYEIVAENENSVPADPPEAVDTMPHAMTSMEDLITAQSARYPEDDRQYELPF